jgi:abortive infection bacteriophage resistance protein
MKYSKPHLPYEDQLDLLIRRGLACSDRASTLYWLKRIGYYRLSAYFIPFKDPATGHFRPGTTFEKVIDLYRFDAGLRVTVHVPYLELIKRDGAETPRRWQDTALPR